MGDGQAAVMMPAPSTLPLRSMSSFELAEPLWLGPHRLQQRRARLGEGLAGLAHRLAHVVEGGWLSQTLTGIFRKGFLFSASTSLSCVTGCDLPFLRGLLFSRHERIRTLGCRPECLVAFPSRLSRVTPLPMQAW
jgi:hypothetical protein